MESKLQWCVVRCALPLLVLFSLNWCAYLIQQAMLPPIDPNLGLYPVADSNDVGVSVPYRGRDFLLMTSSGLDPGSIIAVRPMPEKEALPGPDSSGWVVRIDFNPNYASRFPNYVSRYGGYKLAVVLGGKIIATPIVDSALISGTLYLPRGGRNFSEWNDEQAKNVAEQIADAAGAIHGFK